MFDCRVRTYLKASISLFQRMPPKKQNPLSNKERQKIWRDKHKANVESHERYLAAERARHALRKERGTKKTIDKMSKKEKKEQRAKWRLSQKKHRANAKAGGGIMTPPLSPASPEAQGNQGQQATRGRKKLRRDRAKAYKTVEKLKVKLNLANQRVKRVQKRLERSREEKFSNSPRSEAHRLLKSNEKTVKKHLTFSLAVSDALKAKYEMQKSEKKKRFLKRMLDTAILKKYRLMSLAATSVGIERNVLNSEKLKRK